MKRQILIIQAILGSVLVMNAQQWIGTDPIYTNSKVGILTSTPGYPLDVKGIMRSIVSNQSSTSFVLKNDNSSFDNSLFYGYTTRVGTTSFKLLDLRTNNGYSNSMWVDGLGNGYFAGYVGFGTTSPQPGIHVKNTGDSYVTLEKTSASYKSGVQFRYNGSVLFYIHTNTSNNTLNIRSLSETDALPRIAIPYSNKDIYMALSGGNVGIGCTSTGGFKLAVNGKVNATEIVVTSTVPASDYVFEKGYKLKKLNEVEEFVNENKHLPEVPSATNFKENGCNIGQMQDILLRKVEELTLYVIDLNKQIEELKKQNEEYKKNTVR